MGITNMTYANKTISEDFYRIEKGINSIHSNDITVIVFGLLYLKSLKDTIRHYVGHGNQSALYTHY